MLDDSDGDPDASPLCSDADPQDDDEAEDGTGVGYPDAAGAVETELDTEAGELAAGELEPYEGGADAAETAEVVVVVVEYAGGAGALETELEIDAAEIGVDELEPYDGGEEAAGALETDETAIEVLDAAEYGAGGDADPAPPPHPVVPAAGEVLLPYPGGGP